MALPAGGCQSTSTRALEGGGLGVQALGIGLAPDDRGHDRERATRAPVRCTMRLHGDRSTPNDAGPHRQPNRIVRAVPKEKSLELVIEFISASGLQPRPREAVAGMERLDVAIYLLADDTPRSRSELVQRQ